MDSKLRALLPKRKVLVAAPSPAGQIRLVVRLRVRPVGDGPGPLRLGRQFGFE